MKRQIATGLFVLGLVVGSGLVGTKRTQTDIHNEVLPKWNVIADGDPFPPPFPKLSPQFIADGDPFPPPLPPKGSGIVSSIV
jgi:hypothetical protein